MASNLHAIIPAAGVGRRLGWHGRCAPKSLIRFGGTTLLERTVDVLASRGVQRLTVILGFQGHLIRDCLEHIDTPLVIDFATNHDFDSTEHGYSLYCARRNWERTRATVLLMDADNVFDPAMLDRLIAAGAGDQVLVDPALETALHDEEIVLGEAGRITGFVRGRAADHAEFVGGFVGMNRFTPAYMEALFAFMQGLFQAEGRGFKYERVFHRLLHDRGLAPAWLDTGGLAWVNVNHPDDLERAATLLQRH